MIEEQKQKQEQAQAQDHRTMFVKDERLRDSFSYRRAERSFVVLAVLQYSNASTFALRPVGNTSTTITLLRTEPHKRMFNGAHSVQTCVRVKQTNYQHIERAADDHGAV